MQLDARAEALLLAIRAAPEDTEVRLVFADHIASTCPAHAAWIVAQCTGVDDRGLREDFDRELPERLRGMRTRRGFVDQPAWRFAAPDFAEIDPGVLFRLSPTSSAIELVELDEVAPIVGRLRYFDSLRLLSTRLLAAGARALAHAEGLGHLRSLSFVCSHVDDKLLRILFAGTSMPRLERLELEGASGRITIDALRELARAPFAASLRALDVSSRNLPDLVEVLRELPDLRELAADRSPIDSRFAELPQRFEALALSHCQLDDAAAVALAGSRVLSELRTLAVASNPWTSDGLSALVGSPNLGPLRTLTFGPFPAGLASRRGVAIATALARSPARDTLERLVCLGTAFGADGLRRLGAAEFPRLQNASFYGCELASHFTALTKASWLPQLESLGVGGNDLDERAAHALADVLGETTRVYLMGQVSEGVHTLLHERIGDRLVGG